MKPCFLSIGILFLILVSCTNSNEENFKGQWQASYDEDILYVEINDSLISFMAPAHKCDTTYKIYESSSYKSDNSSDSTKLTFEFEGTPVESEFVLADKNSAMWIWASPIRKDTLFVKAERAEFQLSEEIPSSDRKLSEYNGLIYEKLDSLECLAKRISQNTVTSEEAQEVLNYIDSLKLFLLKPLEEEYSNLKCAFMDLDLDETYASDILIGKSPNASSSDKYSGKRLKQKLQEYSASIKQEQIFEIFPELAQQSLGDQHISTGDLVSWEIYQFYKVPLVLTILKLNELQIKIYRVEKFQSLIE